MTGSAADPAPPPVRRRRSPVVALRSVVHALRRLAPFFRTSRLGVVVLAVLAVVGGVLEASLLALVATVATALSQGQEHVRADLGPADISSSVNVVLMVGIGDVLTSDHMRLTFPKPVRRQP